ncbi:alpha/beta fold hydrolase [Thaumasiovibrio subtropicus]|uniref:alpha/beta fold hydrolase n=1 Tax=Thaumasiovibrio subtropicus TaxID=1891207 RepID=UPI000B356C6C|nr:alpha/beta hydrolase [Thaumasiovibrio subtropicus]
MDIDWIDLYGYKCRYRHAKSSKPVLVFLPGSMQTIENCDDIFSKLSKDFCIYQLEVPGISESDYLPEEKDFRFLGRCVEKFCESLSLDCISLLGFSYGALVSYGFMLESQRVKCAALGGACRRLNESATSDILDAYKHKKDKQAFAQFVTESWMPENTGRSKAIKRAVVSAIRKMSDDMLDKYLANTKRIIINEQNEHNTQPTLLFCGDRDAMISQQEVTEWSTYFLDAKVHFIKNCGHLFHIEARGEVVELTRDYFLSQGDDWKGFSLVGTSISDPTNERVEIGGGR